MADDFWSSPAIKIRFKLLSKLGAGGKGEVYKVHDSYLNKELAIKIIKGEVSESQAVRLQNEAKAYAKLNHENILEVYDFGLAEGNRPYLVMAYVDGLTLSQLVKKEGSLTSEDAVFLFIQLARGMKHAHGQGVLHRDLKPSNVMILEDVEENKTTVKVLDFGLARLKSVEEKSLTQSGEGIGSPYYMSPEQAAGEQIDERADIYSAGCLMYEVLAGRPPFMGESVLETMMMHKSEKPQSINEVLSQSEGDSQPVPKELDELVLSCLAKSKEKRPESFKMLESQLLAILDQFSRDEKQASAYRVKSREEPVPRGVILAVSILVLFVFIAAPLMVIYNRGGSSSQVSSDWKYDTMLSVPKEAKPIYGIERFDNQLVIECNSPVSDDDLKVIATDEKLAKDKFLKKLIFTNGVFAGKGLVNFKRFAIEELAFKNSFITDEAMEIVSEFKGLEVLHISSCRKLTDECLFPLRNLDSLRVVYLEGDQFTEEVFKPLKDFKRLTGIYMKSIKLNAKAINYILASGSLQHLVFTSNMVADDGFAALASSKRSLPLIFQDYVFKDGKLLNAIEKIKTDSLAFRFCFFGKAVENRQFKFSRGLKSIEFDRCIYKFPIDFKRIKSLNPGSEISLRERRPQAKGQSDTPVNLMHDLEEHLKNKSDSQRRPGLF